MTPQWKIEVFPGQVETFSGTVEEVYAQVLEKNPSFQSTFEHNIAEAEAAADVELPSDVLTKRSTVNCNPRSGVWDWANANYLEGFPLPLPF